MTRRHAITPTDAGKPLPANPAYQRVPPVVGRDGLVWLDGGVIADIIEHNRIADERGGKSQGWGRG